MKCFIKNNTGTVSFLHRICARYANSEMANELQNFRNKKHVYQLTVTFSALWFSKDT